MTAPAVTTTVFPVLPDVAVLLMQDEEIDVVTGTVDRIRWLPEFLAYPALVRNDDGNIMVVWSTDDTVRGANVGEFTMDGSDIVAAEGLIRIRHVDPYDAVFLSPGAGVPQPVEVIRMHVLQGGGMLANSLQAVVAPDNSVVTLLLETGSGPYVRYLGAWQQLQDTSQSLEDLELVTVGSGAVDVFDASQNASTTISVFELPTPSASRNDGADEIIDPAEVPTDTAVTLTAAAGTHIPMIASTEDLDLGLRFAAVHPDARWYVAKRAMALGESNRVPTWWWEKAG
jgi:hypothetical protein